MNELLIESQYNDSKLNKSLKMEDYEIIQILIKFIKDKFILNDHFLKYCFGHLYLDHYDKTFNIIKLLVDNGADVNNYPLIKYTISVNNYNVAKLFIDKADINTLDGNLLILACQNNHYGITKLLLEKGINDDKALKTAYLFNNPNITKLLIEYGANLKASDEWSSKLHMLDYVKYNTNADMNSLD